MICKVFGEGRTNQKGQLRDETNMAARGVGETGCKRPSFYHPQHVRARHSVFGELSMFINASEKRKRGRVLECPRCRGRMKIVAAINSPNAIQKILNCLVLQSRAP